jgi:hypothetical protein
MFVPSTGASFEGDSRECRHKKRVLAILDSALALVNTEDDGENAEREDGKETGEDMTP